MRYRLTARDGRGRARLMAGAALASLALAGPVLAQDAGGDSEGDKVTITVTATRQPVAVQDAPATVTVIDEQRIADELATDIKDLVRFEPGVSVPRQPARFGAALGVTGRAGNEGFVIRGIGGNRVLIQVDGVRVPDGFTFGAQSAGRGDYVDLGLVKSVEILRGPASALYGSDGLSGVVSFITSDPADLLDGGSIGGLVRAAYASSDDEFAETAVLAAGGGALSGMVAYTRRDYGELDNKGTVGGTGSARTQPNPQDGRSNAVLGRLVFQPGGGHKLRLTGEYLDTHLFTDVLTGRSATVDLLQARDTGERKRIAADWSWEGSGAIDFARLGVYWQDAEDVQFTDEDRTPAADRERLNTFENRVYGVSGELRSGFATGAATHRLVIGGDISFTRQRGLRDGVVPPAGETFPTRAFPETDYALAGLFVADEIAIGPVTLYPALRLDWYDLEPQNDALLPSFAGAAQSGSRLSPKLGAVVRLGGGFRLLGSYGQGFKAPEPSQVNQFFENLAFGYTSAPNPNLGPERSRSFEGGIRYADDIFSVDLTGFHADYDDFISQEVVSGSFTPADPAVYQFVNLDRAEVSGVELRASVNTAAGFTANLALSYADGDVIDPSGAKSPLSSVDPVKLVAGAGWRDPGGRFGGQLVVTHSARKPLEDTTGLCTGACYRPGAFTILDATAFFKVTEALTLRAGIFNITDRKYAWWNDVRGLSDTSTVKDAYTQPGRNGSVSISYRF
ncbi:TonB-dependent hemoglobin/transferrin/lactoferrin family receptor [Sphingomonas canadensis]|uniref:TonB-dependent hemoglobin/transferrin/lactoferrin family receptor n=1 Tax=Sphingomonas canadensis TaxID=1219257 RepID=A0ABW3H858_9SPHN|nr:TonB-dependent hemoglobin/transferrin/lactoferrin family receptor [Sphingomonas canadensis]MCW3837174.1 TonB-dependent hemoglobin/transferrin/lactoferrin family receptor [Sphingomonas canadensis]